MLTADRRFMLMLACALAALLAVGMLTHETQSSRGRLVATAHNAAPPDAEVTASTAPSSFPPTSVLAPLFSTRIADRFPVIAALVEPGPAVIASKQIVSYYGTVYTPDMGILGTADIETIADELQRHADKYDELNGPMGVIPAMHLVYAVAQYHPTKNGLFLQYVDDADVQRFIDVTARRGMLLFLDLQIGRSSVDDEMQKVLPYLRYPHVHVAIDPEFAVADGEVPGTDLGSLRAVDIDDAQATLQRLVERYGLPPKLLIVHQFVDSMVPDGAAIRDYPGVELIIDMDGFGPAEIKRVKYERYASEPYATHAGIKLFFQHDPDLMSEQDVLLLNPRPTVVIYQ